MRPDDTTFEDIAIVAVVIVLLDVMLFAAFYKAGIHYAVAGLIVAAVDLLMAWGWIRKRPCNLP